jgi:alpha-1,2-mannosyltransferase
MAVFLLEGRDRVVLSVAQFRYALCLVKENKQKRRLFIVLFCSPEKDHPAQLYCLHELLETHPAYRSSDAGIKLVLIGSSRNTEDIARIDQLRRLAKDLDIEVRSGIHPLMFIVLCLLTVNFSGTS